MKVNIYKRDLPYFKKISINKITTPQDGFVVYLDRFWITKNGCVFFYRGYSPQCNSNK